jgi:hypothetical protein
MTVLGWLAVVLALGASVLSSPAAAQPPITVLLDGTAVELDVPPVQIGGRVMVPLRGVLERLGARVVYDALVQTVTISREGTLIMLRLGSKEARINDRIVILDVPALAIQGRTMVPLRFLSEALGARVDWEESNRTVQIHLKGASGSPGGSPGTKTVEGILIKIEPELGRLHILQGVNLHVVTVTGDTAILRREFTSNAGGSANIRELRTGDQVSATFNERMEVISIRAAYQLIRGTVESIAARSITLQGVAGSHQLHPDLVVSGRVRNRVEIQPGMAVVLRLNPVTGIVWEISVE